MKRPGKVQKYWEKAKKGLTYFDGDKVSQINDYFNTHEKFYDV